MSASWFVVQRELVLAADPGGRHDVSMMRLLPAARALRWIVATTPVVRNGSLDAQDTRELDALRTQVEQMFRVDRGRIILEGWSGTGCAAYAQVLLNGPLYRGAIVENAHMTSWRDYGKLATPGKLVYLFTRTGDFNAPHTATLRDTMRAAGYTVEYEELPGAHAPLGPEEMLRAARWMESRL
jgi:predicted esterase